MKVLVISDVHGAKKRMLDILKTHEDADVTISLGDSEMKRSFMEKHDIIAIKGNYPFDGGFTYEHVMNLDGVRTLLTHGHRLKVQNGLDRLYHRMVKDEAHLSLFGHLHKIVFEHSQGRYMINPGSVGSTRSTQNESYLVMTFNEKAIDLTWYDAENHEPISDAKIERKALKDV
ncbi:MAG: metallophosphoesterase family protein [Bacillota bacterium]